MPSIVTGDFVHVVATVNTKATEGKILYVNPSSTTVESDAAPDQQVKLMVTDGSGEQLYLEPVVVRHSSCEGEGRGDVGMIQADIPVKPGMSSILLLVDGKEVSRYDAGALPETKSAVTMGLGKANADAPHRRALTLAEASQIKAEPGISYSIQVKPDNSNYWNTIAVGRATPAIEIDRNQFAGATKAEVKVLRTTGFSEQVVAEEVVDLFKK
ncbi:hypothetical protein [Rhizobium sp. SG570]|uniref:hypothetical protein n=1 Tax=Rhizobium sp. SG570 TaxID=2587113 RepID=UPI001448949D|nr:hypothetical protein [Rhizobium sp. SG570]NKJ37362.1 hypothetical protein [Rhizobium sp. SG570]